MSTKYALIDRIIAVEMSEAMQEEIQRMTTGLLRDILTASGVQQLLKLLKITDAVMEQKVLAVAHKLFVETVKVHRSFYEETYTEEQLLNIAEFLEANTYFPLSNLSIIKKVNEAMQPLFESFAQDLLGVNPKNETTS